MNACVIVRACSCALLCMQLLRTAACYLGSAVTWPLLRNTRGGSSAEGNDHTSHSQDFLNFSTCTWGTVSVGALLQILFKGEMLLAVLRVTAVINQVKKKKSSMQPQCFLGFFSYFTHSCRISDHCSSNSCRCIIPLPPAPMKILITPTHTSVLCWESVYLTLQENKTYAAFMDLTWIGGN